MAMVAGLVILAGCSEKEPMTSTQQSNVPTVTKEPSSSASAPATPAAPAPATPAPTPPEPAPPTAPPPANTGAANALTNTNAPEAK